MSRKKKIWITVSAIIIVLLLSVFSYLYYSYFRKDYGWYEDIDLGLDYSGSTIIVDQNGTGDYLEVEEALDIAGDGDTILVYSGLYSVQSTISSNIRIVGNGSSTILTASFGSYIFETLSGSKGISIEKLRFSTVPNFTCNSAIDMRSERSIIRDCIFEGEFLDKVLMSYSRECLILSNTFIGSSYDAEDPRYYDLTGISTLSCEYVLVRDNHFRDLGHGAIFSLSSRCAFVENTLFGCYKGVIVDDGMYNVIKVNEYDQMGTFDIVDDGWKTKIEEKEGTKIEEGHSTFGGMIVCGLIIGVSIVIPLIILIDVALVIKWLLKRDSKKVKEIVNEVPINEHQKKKDDPEKVSNEKKQPKHWFKGWLSYPVLFFNYMMFLLLLLITIISFGFFFVADFEGEKYICCLFPLLPVPVLGLMLFGILLLANILTIVKENRGPKR